jgi:surfeit locus 1 family protein
MKKFPIGLTIATAIAFAILCGLGGWQLKRLAWKQDLLAKIETLKTAPAVPIKPMLARAAGGEDVSWTRVAVDCRPPGELLDASPSLATGVRDGEIIWRAYAVCALSDGPNDAVLLDLGIVDALTGQVKPKPMTFATPARVTGVLISPKWLGGTPPGVPGARPASETLKVETASPPTPGVTPSAIPLDISNRHLEYALTWFGLAGALLAVYAALVRRRMKAP